MKILKQNELNIAAELLKEGELVAFPTETVFGIGVIYDNESSYNNLIKVKRRPPEKPFSLMIASTMDIKKYAYINENAKKIIDTFLPGQLTIILKAKENLPHWVVSKENKVGIRVPDFIIANKLIALTGKPLLVPSANHAGDTPCHTSNEVMLTLDGEVAAVIEGESTSNIASTIVEITDNAVNIIREGVIKKEDIYNCIGVK